MSARPRGRGPVAAQKAASTIFIATILLSANTASADSPNFPYVPTTILVPPQPIDGVQQSSTSLSSAGHAAYVFRKRDSNVQLLSLDTSSSVEGSSTAWTTLSENVPFLDNMPETAAFSAAMGQDGSILVFAGDCGTSYGASVWRFGRAADAGPDAEATWTKADTTPADSEFKSAVPFFLGGGLAFSNTLAPSISDPVLYSYGGMCGKQMSPQTPQWQGNGTYSNRMLKITKAGSGYSIAPVPTKGAPVPAAGFSLTGVTPSVSNRSGTLTQQANYVMLGGHTVNAFVNMSTAAIWNLPEETWRFISLQAPGPASDTSSTELKAAVLKRDDESTQVTEVDSRSGHTAVLSADGDSLVVLGGWVGDPTQPAEPQLAVLNMGNTYGQWQWSVPSTQPDWYGMFGHGAALLPGNVMMVYGGYEIAKPGTKAKRAVGDQPLFLDLKSMSWSSSYTNPNPATNTTLPTPLPAPSNDSKKGLRVGLGVGLGLGLALLAALLVGGFCVYRNRKRRNMMRDDTIRSLSQDNTRFLHDGDHEEPGEKAETGENAGWGSWATTSWYSGGHDPYTQVPQRSLGYESLRGGRPGQVPPQFGGGPSIPRKPVARHSGNVGNRPVNINHMAIPGQIHPIYEADEDESPPSAPPPQLNYDHQSGLPLLAEKQLLQDKPQHPLERSTTVRDADHPRTPTSAVYSDPFATPPHSTHSSIIPSSAALPPVYTASYRNSRTPSPENIANRHDPAVQDWMWDVTAANQLLAEMERRRSQRGSPTRGGSTRSGSANGMAEDDARTGSNLSESNHSALSIARSLSALSPGRSTVLNSSAINTTVLTIPSTGGNPCVGTDGRLDSPATHSSTSTHGSHPSYNTARSNFSTLQAEGPHLLRGSTAASASAAYSYLLASRGLPEPHDVSDEEDMGSGSPSKSKPRRDWLGSLRRVFSNGGPHSGTALLSSSGLPGGEHSPQSRDSLEHTGGDFEPRPPGSLSGLGSTAGLLRRKQGRHAWEDTPGGEQSNPFAAAADHTVSGNNGARRTSAEEEWDIERAVEQRLVQVMFTVPKEPLRVVNGEVEDEAATSKISLPLEPTPSHSTKDTQDTVKESDIIERTVTVTTPELPLRSPARAQVRDSTVEETIRADSARGWRSESPASDIHIEDWDAAVDDGFDGEEADVGPVDWRRGRQETKFASGLEGVDVARDIKSDSDSASFNLRVAAELPKAVKPRSRVQEMVQRLEGGRVSGPAEHGGSMI